MTDLPTAFETSVFATEFDKLLAEVDLTDALSVDESTAPAAAPAAVRVERAAAAPVTEHLYGYVVTNDLGASMTDVRVDHDLPPNTRCVGVKPAAKLNENRLTWALGTIPPQGILRLKLKVVPINPAEPFSADRAAFRVSHTTANRVRQAELTLTVTGPEALPVGSSGEWRVLIRNDGSAAAAGVELAARRGPGLLGPDGAADSVVPLDTLEAGEAVTVVVAGLATAAGSSALGVAVTLAETSGLAVDYPVHVTAPRPTAEWAGHGMWILGAEATATLVLKNDGTAAAAGVAAFWTVPAGLEVIAYPAGVECPPPGDALAVAVETLAVGDELRFPVKFRATGPGDWSAAAEVLRHGHAPVRTTFPVRVEFDSEAPAGPLAGLVADLDAGLALAAPSSALPAAPVETGVRSVVFTLGPTNYALPLDAVLEIGPPLPTTPVPHVPSWIAGVANCRGDVVSVVHLGRFAGLADRAPRRLLLVRDPAGADVTAGFLVDHVTGIQALPTELTPTADVRATDPLAAVAAGVAVTPAGLTVVLSPAGLLAATAAG